MSEPVLLSGFSNTDLIDFRYHLDHEDFSNSLIDLVIRSRDGLSRELRFRQVSNLKIDEGFSGGLSGMIIVDISSRQWSNARVEVQNFEQDAGITFLAQKMEVVIDEFNT
jgi:hypothetical protein